MEHEEDIRKKKKYIGMYLFETKIMNVKKE